MQCPTCGQTLPEEAQFCSNCGTNLHQVADDGAPYEPGQKIAEALAAHVASIGVSQQLAAPAAPSAPISSSANAPLPYPLPQNAPAGMPVSPYGQPTSQHAQLASAIVAAQQASDIANFAEAKYQRLLHTRRTCFIWAIVIAVLGFQALLGMFISAHQSNPDTFTDMGQIIGVCIFLTCCFFFVPFGFAPLKHFIDNHGFFIVFNLVFLCMAAMIALMFSIIVGPIYLIYLMAKIPQAREDALLARQHAQSLGV